MGKIRKLKKNDLVLLVTLIPIRVCMTFMFLVRTPPDLLIFISLPFNFTIYCFFTDKTKDDSFSIQKKENSIQKKRHYRTNKDSSDSNASGSDNETANRPRGPGGDRSLNRDRDYNPRKRDSNRRSPIRGRSRSRDNRRDTSRRGNSRDRDRGLNNSNRRRSRSRRRSLSVSQFLFHLAQIQTSWIDLF